MKQFWIVFILIMIFVIFLLMACSQKSDSTSPVSDETYDQHDSTKPQIRTEIWLNTDDDELVLAEKNAYKIRIYDRHGHHISDSECGVRIPCNPVFNFEYDDQGNIIEFTWAIEDSPNSHTETYDYDDEGRILTITHKGPTDYRSYTLSYEYDDEGNRIKYADQKTDGSVKYYTYEHDEEGNLEVYSHVDGVSYVNAICQYDENGNEVLRISMLPSGEIHYETKYDDGGNILQQRDFFVSENGTKDLRATTTYNENGDEAQVTRFTDDSVYTYYYPEFDDFGNWTKRVISCPSFTSGDQPYFRILTYY